MKVEELEILVTDYKNGTNDNIDNILKAFYPFIIYRSKLVYINGLSTDDIMQECNISLLKSIDKYQINSNKFYGYGCIVVKNRIKELIRNNCKNNKATSCEVIEVTSPDNSYICINNRLDLQRAIQRLDAPEQQIIIDYFFKDKSIIAISKNNKIVAKKNYKILQKALINLKKLL